MDRAASAAVLLLPLSCAADYYSRHVDHICLRCVELGGEGHVCGRTVYCRKCGADCASLETHRCHLTRYCPRCERDVGLHHVCGVTRFCESCRQEVGEGHVCGRTRFCRACGREVPRPHAHEGR